MAISVPKKIYANKSQSCRKLKGRVLTLSKKEKNFSQPIPPALPFPTARSTKVLTAGSDRKTSESATELRGDFGPAKRSVLVAAHQEPLSGYRIFQV